MWLATVRSARTAIMAASEDIFIPEINYQKNSH